jgi:hypothetical protein
MPCAEFANGNIMLSDSTKIMAIAIGLSILVLLESGDRFTNDFFRGGHADANLV